MFCVSLQLRFMAGMPPPHVDDTDDNEQPQFQVGCGWARGRVEKGGRVLPCLVRGKIHAVEDAENPDQPNSGVGARADVGYYGCGLTCLLHGFRHTLVKKDGGTLTRGMLSLLWA